MWRTSSFLPLNENADVRAITFSPPTCASALMISSARPSPKYSFSRSALRLANGSTAIDAVASAIVSNQPLDRDRAIQAFIVRLVDLAIPPEPISDSIVYGPSRVPGVRGMW